MQNTLLSTKLFFPPARPALVPRSRLVERLQAGLQVPLTLISAPAGSGKTTLFSQWRSGPGMKVPVAWISLDSSDNDLSRFLQYLSKSLATLQPNLEKETLQVLPSSQGPDWDAALTLLIDRLGDQEDNLPLESLQKDNSMDVWPLFRNAQQPDWEAILSILINRLNNLDKDVFLALDDYHTIENQLIHSVMVFLLEHLPRHLHLVLFTRADPPFPLARLRACQQLVEIRDKDLRFSLDESTNFLKEIMGLDLTSEQIAALDRRTEGWVAGLQLAAISMQGRDDLQGFVTVFTGSHHYIVDYLMEEVLDHQPECMREFLLKSSVLSRLTGSLCDVVTGQSNGNEILNRLYQSNLFITALDDQHRWYRYHHLFSDLLRELLEKTYPGLSKDLHKVACHWHEAHGLLPEALQHAISSKDMQLVEQVISANVFILTENDEVLPLLQEIDSLPAEQLIALPWLGIGRARIVGTRHIQESHKILDEIEINLKKSPDNPEKQRLQSHITAARAYLYYSEGDVEKTAIYARLADESLQENEITARCFNLVIWGNVLIDAYHDTSAVHLIEKALVLARQTRKPHIISIAITSLANAYLHEGKLHATEEICLEALAIANDYENRFNHPLTATAEIYSILSRVYCEWGRYDQAIKIARRGVILADQSGFPMAKSMCLSYLGRALVYKDQWQEAIQVFQQAEHLTRMISHYFWKLVIIYSLDSLLDIEGLGTQVVTDLFHRVEDSGAHLPPILSARLDLRSGHPKKALLQLDHKLMELHGNPSLDNVRIHGLRALSYQALGDEKQALVALQIALQLAEIENQMATFRREGTNMQRLLQLAIKRSIYPRFVKQVLETFENRRVIDPGLPVFKSGFKEDLSPRELEVLQQLAQGRSDKQIAEALVIARETVHKHLKNIYAKLNVHSRTEAIATAHRLGLL